MKVFKVDWLYQDVNLGNAYFGQKRFQLFDTEIGAEEFKKKLMESAAFVGVGTNITCTVTPCEVGTATP